MPGGLNDDNGYLPFTAPMPLAAKRWDANIVAFSVACRRHRNGRRGRLKSFAALLELSRMSDESTRVCACQIL